MTLEWETGAWPVLQAVYAAYSKAPLERVTQERINAELGREAEDPATDLVLYHLAEAGYLRTISKTWLTQGPTACEPTEKAFQRLADWPAADGETVLARLIGAIEARIEETDDPEERGKLQRLLNGIEAVGQSFIANVRLRGQRLLAVVPDARQPHPRQLPVAPP